MDQLHELKAWVVGNLPLAVGVAVSLLVLIVWGLSTLFRRRSFDPATLVPATAPNTGITEQALNWEAPEPSYADRRGAVRRQGTVVRVTLASPTFRNGVADGFVLDRSTGGLKLAVQTGMAPGSTLQVRAVDAPDTVGFVTVIVRNCRKNKDHFELGCEFEKTPPWNVLLLFG